MTDETFDPDNDRFHVLNLCGTIFYISDTARREIEHMVRNAANKWDFIVVETLDGSEITVIVDAVNVIWSTSPESRERERKITAAISSEVL